MYIYWILSIYFEKKQQLLDFPGSLVVRALDCGPKGRRFEPDPGRNGFFILRGLVLRSYSGLPTTPARDGAGRGVGMHVAPSISF